MGKVWELQLPANKLLVLLAMADHADHNGDNIFPGMALIAYKTGYSERQVKRIVAQLVKDGILFEHGGRSRLGTKMYSINLDAGVQKPAFEAVKQSDKMSHSQSDKMSPSEDASEVTNHALQSDILTPERSDILSSGSDIAVSPKPSLEPSKEKPSLEPSKEKEIAPFGATPAKTQPQPEEKFDIQEKANAVIEAIGTTRTEQPSPPNSGQPPSPKQIKNERALAVERALEAALDYQQGDITKGLRSSLFKVAHQLVDCDNPVQPQEVQSLVTFVKSNQKDGRFSIWWVNPAVGDWRKWQRERQPAATPDAPDGRAYITGKYADFIEH